LKRPCFASGAKHQLQWETACLVEFAGETDMPTLFGYLVALALLLGVGYAGLQWLASPDAVSTHQRADEKPTARNVAKKSEKSEKSEQSEFNGAGATAVPGEADDGSKIATTASATPDREAPQQPDHRANETATISKPGDSTPRVNDDSARAGRNDHVASTSGTGNLNSEPELRQGTPAEADREGSRDAKQKDDAPIRAIARTPKPGEPRPEPGLRPRRPDKRHVRSSHSGLVMMYLRTIEFPDGHREQQLLPIRRSRRMAVEVEDQW
jgi:hypothetical protein